MKDINVTVTTRASIIAGALALLILAGTIGWTYKEMSSMRRDLYAVRHDYYEGYSDESGKVDYSLISQEVKDLRAVDGDAEYICDDVDKYSCEPVYKKQSVRVVELKVKNDLDYLFTYYDGSLSGVGDNGRLVSTLVVHDDDNLNDWYKSNYGNLELIPGGEATIYVYLPGDSQEITSLYNTELSEEVKLK